MNKRSSYNAGPVTVTRTSKEVDDVLNEVAENIDEGRSKFPGMSYEEGVRNALDWIRGYIDDNPMED